MNRISELRKLKGYSQKELGDKLNKSLYTVSKWEKELREPSKEDIRLLCAEFEVTSDYLLGFTDVNLYSIELSGAQIPKPLRDEGLEQVRLLRKYVDEHGGIHPDVQRELLRLIAEAKLIQESEQQDKSGPGQ